MPTRQSTTGSELFIVDNSDEEWKVLRYLHDWCQISKGIDCATGYFEIGSLLALEDEWQKVDQFRILLGDEVSHRTKNAFAEGLKKVTARLDGSLEAEKQKNDFLVGVPAIVDALRSGKIACRVYRKDKFHAKAYITHARMEVVGSSALVGSSNFTYPGLTENVELNVQITGQPVAVLQEWYEEHWDRADDVTPEILRTIERHAREYSPFDVYARSLHEFFRQREMTDREWLENKSRVYPVLDQYQKDGFHEVMAIADKYHGAFLCDGVGLGKTFIGLMVFAMPAPPAPAALVAPGFSPAGAALKGASDVNVEWTEDSGDTRWYLFDVGTEKIAEDPADIVKLIRCTPETARQHDIPNQTLSEIRAKVEKHIKNTYLKQVQAPMGIRPTLKCWLELS